MDDLGGLLRGLGEAGDPTGAPDGADRVAADPAASLAGLAGALAGDGGLDDLVGRLQSAGLGGAVASWVGAGSNEAVEPQRLGAALGPEKLQRLSAGSGLDIGVLLPMLAAFLPQIIDMLTPDGALPDGGLNGAVTGGGLPDLGGLLGGVLGSGGGAGGELDDVLGGLGGMLGGSRR